MLHLLELIVGLLEVVEYWRFCVCLLLAVALVALIYWLIPNQGVCLALAIPIVGAGLATGIIWQRRSR